MKKVLVQYVVRYVGIMYKAAQQKRNMTHAEKMGVAYYKAAAQRVSALIDAPTPEWIGLRFSKSHYTR